MAQEKPAISLGKNASMRDVGDYCKKYNIPSLAQGMIELPPPIKLRELAASYALSEEVHQYRDRYGEPIFLEAIQKLLQQHYGIKVSQSNIMATHGVSGSCITALMYLRYENKTRVGLVSPFYTYHLKEVQAVFSKDPVFIPMFDYENLLAQLNFNVLEDALKQGLDCLIICNPSNPTGRVWTKSEIEKVVSLCEQYNCTLLLDECYCDMVWEPNHYYTPLPPFHGETVSPNVIVCRGFSKVLGCQSWRIGYVVAHESIIPKMMVIHDPLYVCAPWVQHAIGDFLVNHYDLFKTHCVEIGKLMRSNWTKLRDALVKCLAWEPVEPQGTMYGMFKHKSETDMDAIIKALEKGVGCVPCTLFFPGLNQKTGYVRIHCGVTAEKADLIVKILNENSSQ